MSGLTGKGGHPGNEYIGIQVQTSLKGVPIPRGWGTFKADCNLIDYLNFYATSNGSGGKGSGGKGGGGGKGSGTTYSYTANVLLGIIGQQIYGIRAIWRDSDVLIDGTSSSTSLAAPFRQAVFSLANYQTSSGSTTTSTHSSVTTSALAQAGLSLANGAIGQSACSATSSTNTTTYWMYNANQTAVYDGSSHALGYSGMAYVYASNYALNSGASVPNHSFEVQTTTRQVIGGQTQDDANPADIVNDFLPSVPNWPSGIIGSTSSYHDYALVTGLLISPYVNQQRSGADLLNEILECSNSDTVWSNGQLQFVPYGDTAMTANGVTWTPNLTPVYALGWSDILDAGGDDPIKWEIRPQAQCYNYVQVGFLDRINQYVSDTMPAYDQANIDQYGLNKQDPVTLNAICLPSVAQTISQLKVQRSANIRRTCTFKVAWIFDLLDPMDLITVPLRNGGSKLVRVIETDEKDGEITITAEEMLVGAAHAATYSRQASIPSGTNVAVNPGSASAPLVIHPPASLINDNEVWLAGCSNYGLWGGAVVWVSTDGTNYNPVGTLRGSSAMGVLTANLATYGGSNPDTGHTLSVDMSMSAVGLQTVTSTDAANGVTLAIIDNELVTFQTATLTAINQYNLTGLYRGFGGTTAAAHTTGTPIVFLHGQLFKYVFDATQLGQTLYFKLQSFNLYGSGYQNLAACTAYSVTLAQTYSNDVAWANVYGTGKPQDNATANAVRGAWATATAYALGDIVYYGGASYSCLTAHTSAAGNIPPSANWQVFAAAGVNPVVGYLTNAAVTLPANSAGIVTSYAAATGTFKVFSGTTDVTTSSAFAAGAQTNCTATVNATTGAYSVTTMSAATGSFTMSATYGGVTVTQVFTLATAPTGATGSTGAAGTNGATGPGGPVVLIASTNGDAFTFTDGVASPASQTLNFVANRQNTSGSINWTSSPSVTLTVTGTGNVNAALTLANFGANSQVAITATDSTTGASDTITVVKLTASTAAAGATVGAAWASNLTGKPANIAALTGTEPIQNALVPVAGANRVPMSQFEAGTTPWYISAYGSAYGGALTVAASGAYQDLVFTCAFTGTGQYQSIVGGAFPVTAGEQLAIQSRISTNGNCTVAMGLAFSTGATPQVLPTAGISTPADYLFQGMYTAPTGATTAQLVAFVYSTGASAARFTLSQPMVAGVPTGQTVYPAFSPGPNAFNGADVTGSNTANNTNNVGSITAGSVTSTINSGGGVATNQVTTASLVLGAATAPNASLNASGTGSSATYLYKQFSGGGSTYTTPTGQTLTSVTFTSTGGFIRLDLGVSLVTVTSSSPLTGVSGASQQIALVRTQSGVSTVLQSWPYSAGVSEFWVDTGAAAGSVTYSIQFLPCPTGGVSVAGGSGTGAQVYSNTQTLNVSWSGGNLVEIEYRR